MIKEIKVVRCSLLLLKFNVALYSGISEYWQEDLQTVYCRITTRDQRSAEQLTSVEPFNCRSVKEVKRQSSLHRNQFLFLFVLIMF